MGDLIGHVVPGIMSILFGFWWTYNVYFRYFNSKKFEISYRSSSTFACDSACFAKRKWPIEAILKIVFSSAGIAGEVIMGMKHGRLVHLGNLQHVTMYGFFWLNGVTELCSNKKCRKTMPNMGYVTLALAFAIEAFLFSNHLHGRSPMNIQLHTFLIYAIIGCLVFTLMEMAFPENVLPALARAFCACMHGSWLIQIGILLYLPTNQPWDSDPDEDDYHAKMMWITLSYTWHIAAMFLIQAGMGFLVWLRVECIKIPDSGEPQIRSINSGRTYGFDL